MDAIHCHPTSVEMVSACLSTSGLRAFVSAGDSLADHEGDVLGMRGTVASLSGNFKGTDDERPHEHESGASGKTHITL